MSRYVQHKTSYKQTQIDAAGKLWSVVSKHLHIMTTEEPRVKHFNMYKSETFLPQEEFGLYDPNIDPEPIFEYKMKLACFGYSVHLDVYILLNNEDSGNDDGFVQVMNDAECTEVHFKITDRTGELSQKCDLIKFNGCKLCKEIVHMLGCDDLIDELVLYEELVSNLEE
jgi:hypothetical protein